MMSVAVALFVGGILLPEFCLCVSALCPPGYVLDRGECMCASKDQSHLTFHQMVECDIVSNTSRMIEISCISLDFGYPNQSRVVAGRCQVAYSNFTTLVNGMAILQLPDNAELLDEALCWPIRRTGTLCGCCRQNSSININSPFYDCIPSSICKQLPMFFLTTLGPTAVLFLAFVVLQPKFTGPSLASVIFMAQLITSQAKYLTLYISMQLDLPENLLEKVFSCIYGL